MTNIVPIMKGAQTAPKSVSSQMDTLIFSRAEIEALRLPPFQRPLRVNDKVRSIAEELKTNGGVISGVITLGRLPGEKGVLWVVDGQHRIEAFKISELDECIVDVRICSFDSMGEMGDHFVTINSQIVKFRPDDVLRGLEGSMKPLRMIRESCEFVGYDNVRRGSTGSAVLSMSVLLRSWVSSGLETPTANSGSATQCANDLDESGAAEIIRFLSLTRAAWGGDQENYRLWTSLNLTLCMWLYRQMVLGQDRAATKRFVRISADQFKRTMMSVSANRDYVDWLVGRALNERDRSPCYARLKAIVANRLKEDMGDAKKLLLPQPAWSSNMTLKS